MKNVLIRVSYRIISIRIKKQDKNKNQNCAELYHIPYIVHVLISNGSYLPGSRHWHLFWFTKKKYNVNFTRKNELKLALVFIDVFVSLTKILDLEFLLAVIGD